ncbi:MAG: hypothetical protein LLG20_27560 [Acidobacteriales bacterium]|nr:hypothetical protein [Terriglobales bacterium]
MRPRIILVFLLMAMAALAATARLYLKDGTYQIVREYKVEGERVRYYSTERGEWEEIPLDMVDLKRTESEVKEREASRSAEVKALEAEDRAEKAERAEIARVPQENGVYLVEGKELRALKQAESKVVSNKRRSVLKVLSPVPMVAGKATVELDGASSNSNKVALDKPEFYFRMAYNERLKLVRLTPKKDARVVQRWSIIPVTKEVVEEEDEVPTFKRQLEEGLYKIWPINPLAAGEYAVVEYTEGQRNIQVWDFSCRPPSSGK